jgi:hypothetical protein
MIMYVLYVHHVIFKAKLVGLFVCKAFYYVSVKVHGMYVTQFPTRARNYCDELKGEKKKKKKTKKKKKQYETSCGACKLPNVITFTLTPTKPRDWPNFQRERERENKEDISILI